MWGVTFGNGLVFPVLKLCSNMTSQPLKQQTLYRLRCLDGVIRGEELDILVPFETIRALSARTQPRQSLSPAKLAGLSSSFGSTGFAGGSTGAAATRTPSTGSRWMLTNIYKRQ